MKVFQGTPKDEYGEKVNFVDEANVFVGFDMEQDCCEHAGWFIANDITAAVPDVLNQSTDLDGWLFDRDYFAEVLVQEESFDGGGMVAFRMVKGDAVQYLHLFNMHNAEHDTRHERSE